MADLDGRLSPACLEDLEDESLDPRIQVELERLNKASEDINKLELELDDARASFRQALSDSTHKLNDLAKKLGNCVEKARPYYDSRLKIKEAHIESQKAALRFERACSMHEAAKEMVQLAEQGYMCREEPSDPAWQEMLNHATMKVNEAEKERNESEEEHMKMTLIYNEADARVQYLQKDLKRAINKSKPYFEMKSKFNQSMEDQKRTIHILEEDVASSKTMYSEALRNLEVISEDIHHQRLEKRKQLELGVRGAGVGSESPSPPPVRGEGFSSAEGQRSIHTSSCQSQSPTTVTSSQNRVIKGHLSTQEKADSEFKFPSVIHSTVGKSRTPSYRAAVDHRYSESDDFPVPSMDEEYRSLPSSKTQNRNSAELRHHRESFSMEGTPSTSITPPGRRKKLQGGLILRIDASMDPLTQQYQAMDIRPTRQLAQTLVKNEEQGQGADKLEKREFFRAGKQKSLEFPKNNPFGPPLEKKMGENSNSSRKLKMVISPSRQSLGVPGSRDADDESDTESVASAGPMLDDDQVEYLTLEFSDKASVDSESPSLGRQEWNRMSLPSNLGYLESFLRQKSQDEKKLKEKSTEADDGSEDTQNFHEIDAKEIQQELSVTEAEETQQTLNKKDENNIEGSCEGKEEEKAIENIEELEKTIQAQESESSDLGEKENKEELERTVPAQESESFDLGEKESKEELERTIPAQESELSDLDEK